MVTNGYVLVTLIFTYTQNHESMTFISISVRLSWQGVLATCLEDVSFVTSNALLDVRVHG